MRHQQLVGAIHVNHGNHPMITLDFAHQGGAAGGFAERDLEGLAVGSLAFPGAGDGL